MGVCICIYQLECSCLLAFAKVFVEELAGNLGFLSLFWGASIRRAEGREKSGFSTKSYLAECLDQLCVSFGWLAAGVPADFSKTDGTHGQRGTVNFLHVHGTIHQALKRNAVCDGEYVSYFVNGDFECPPKGCEVFLFGAFGVAHPIERPHANSTAEIGLSVNEVPSFARPQIE